MDQQVPTTPTLLSSSAEDAPIELSPCQVPLPPSPDIIKEQVQVEAPAPPSSPVQDTSDYITEQLKHEQEYEAARERLNSGKLSEAEKALVKVAEDNVALKLKERLSSRHTKTRDASTDTSSTQTTVSASTTDPRLVKLKERKPEFDRKKEYLIERIVQLGGDPSIRKSTISGTFKKKLRHYILARMGMPRFPKKTTLKRDYLHLPRDELVLRLCTEGIIDSENNVLIPKFSKTDLISAKKLGAAASALGEDSIIIKAEKKKRKLTPEEEDELDRLEDEREEERLDREHGELFSEQELIKMLNRQQAKKAEKKEKQLSQLAARVAKLKKELSVQETESESSDDDDDDDDEETESESESSEETESESESDTSSVASSASSTSSKKSNNNNNNRVKSILSLGKYKYLNPQQQEQVVAKHKKKQHKTHVDEDNSIDFKSKSVFGATKALTNTRKRKRDDNTVTTSVKQTQNKKKSKSNAMK